MALPLPHDLDMCVICEDEIDYSKDNIHCLTWSIKPRTLTNWGRGNFRNYNLQWEMCCYALKCIDQISDKYVFLPELADDGRLHIHGWFNLKNYRKFYRSFLPYLDKEGWSKCDKVKSTEWYTYYKKDLHITREVIDCEDLVVSHYNHHDVLNTYEEEARLGLIKKPRPSYKFAQDQACDPVDVVENDPLIILSEPLDKDPLDPNI